jgi:hypothetical protein
MLSLVDVSGISWLVLHLGADHYWFIPKPSESHHAFGAGFLFIGSLMTVESVSGGVWYRSTMRTLMFPATLVFLGWGMLAVTAIEPNARIAHVSMGLPMIAGGWAEARYRLGDLERKYADVFIVPALALAAADTAFFHLTGGPTSTGFLTHGGLIVLSLVIAALRLYQTAEPRSVWRSLFISAAVIAVGLDLWVDAFYQSS